jgi:LysM repeat protein
MKRIITCLGLIIMCHGNLPAQDDALVERVNRLSIYVEELMADKARQQKQITDLTRELENLRGQVQRASNGASREDVRALADALQQLERKQREDTKSVADAIEKLGKASATAARASTPASPSRAAERGWEYTVEPGNTLSAIAQAYREKFNIKVTPDDILKANPGLKATSLQVGKVIFIPEK